MEKLVQKFEIIEWREGCIYRTKCLGEFWVPMDTEIYKVIDGKYQYVNLGTKRMKELNFKITR